ncbi:MAG: Gfo/Idh/MocA family oxidoreductase [Chitinophagales bacterium]|nr:Gfo/Idh/MocA family oxidoreductase [Chitinophagales bacterium]
MYMLKAGVLGAGHLGKIHIKLLKEVEGVELVGFYDPDDGNAAFAEKEFDTTSFDSMEKLVAACDMVDIVTPTLSHYECAEYAIKEGKHIFIEKPLTNTLEEAELLLALVEEADIKAQVGHVERFNPAFLALSDVDFKPMFIETHRLAMFNPRGTDVSVVMDLMIHDIDIILSITNANVQRISASGVPVLSSSPDIANARIEFDNGCVANVTASRISMKNMRKMRVFQPECYISVDFLKKKSEVIKISDNKPEHIENPLSLETNEGEKFIDISMPEIKNVNSIKLELEMFRDAILQDSETAVSVEDGYNAMKIASQILQKINKNQTV